jgi:uracil-DNA glycosylase family 4
MNDPEESHEHESLDSPVPLLTGFRIKVPAPGAAHASTSADLCGLMARMSGEAEWDDLERAIVACRRCPRLVAWREETAAVKRRAYRTDEYWGQPVPGWGDRDGRVLIVGLAPAAHGGNRTGRIFTGDSSGDFLFAGLHRAGFANQPLSRQRGDGLALADVYVAAAARCAPPANKPTPEELAACLPYLVQEIRLLARLQVIVALGRIGFEAVLRVYQGRPGFLGRPALLPQFAHAAVVPLGEGLPTAITSYHPSRQNTQTGRLTAEMFDRVWQRTRNLLDTV